jgi:hypothetical protein
MEKIKWIKTKSQIILVSDNYSSITFFKGSKKFKRLEQLINKKDNTSIFNLVFKTHKKIKIISDDLIIKSDGILYYNDEVIPKLITEKIIHFHDKKLSFDYIIKFWNNLKSNPNKLIHDQLYKFLTANQYSFTTDGCFIGYRRNVLREGKIVDGYTKTLDNSLGKTVAIPREECDSDPESTCSKGLHVASFDYGYSGDIHCSVKVNPKDVVAVPSEYNAGKLRCCEYIVIEIDPKKPTDDLVNIQGKKLKNLLKMKVEYIKEKQEDVLLDLSNLTAKQIISNVFEVTGELITISVKSKKSIIKKAKLILDDFKVEYK